MRKSGWFERKTTLRKTDDTTQQSCPLISSVQEDLLSETDQFRFQGNCPPTPPHNPTFCPNWNTNVDVELARGRWAVSSKPKLIPKGFCYNSVALKYGWGRLFFGWTTFTFGLRQAENLSRTFSFHFVYLHPLAEDFDVAKHSTNRNLRRKSM